WPRPGAPLDALPEIRDGRGLAQPGQFARQAGEGALVRPAVLAAREVCVEGRALAELAIEAGGEQLAGLLAADVSGRSMDSIHGVSRIGCGSVGAEPRGRAAARRTSCSRARDRRDMTVPSGI